MKLLFLVLSLIVGVCATAQAGCNGRLGQALDSGMYVLFICFAIGAVASFFMRVIEAAYRYEPLLDNTRPQGVLGAFKRAFALRPGAKADWRIIIPGAVGVIFVVMGTLVPPELGLGLVFVFQIIGSLICSCILDHFALVGVPRTRFTIFTAAGIAVAIVGAVLTVVSQIQDSPPTSAAVVTAFLAILTFVVGLIFPLQSAYNGLFANTLFLTPLAATASALWGGTLIGFVCAIINSLAKPSIFYDLADNARMTTWWMYMGGVLGIFIVVILMQALDKIGVALTLSVMLAGQLTSSVVFDDLNVFGLGVFPASAIRIAGVIVAFVAVVIIAFAPTLATKFLPRPAEEQVPAEAAAEGDATPKASEPEAVKLTPSTGDVLVQSESAETV